MAETSDQRVFLVDEDEVVRDSLKVLLESHGIQVEDFSTAAEFLGGKQTVRNGVLVLGYNRQIAGGLEMIDTLRQRRIAMPVILIVGGGNALTRAATLNAGAFAYLERPIEETALIRTIKAALLRQNGNKHVDGGAQAEPPMASIRR